MKIKFKLTDANFILSQIKFALDNASIKYDVRNIVDDYNDTEVQLHGKYATIHIQIGDGYYSVVKDVKNGFIYRECTGDLYEDIETALNYNEKV